MLTSGLLHLIVSFVVLMFAYFVYLLLLGSLAEKKDKILKHFKGYLQCPTCLAAMSFDIEMWVHGQALIVYVYWELCYVKESYVDFILLKF